MTVFVTLVPLSVTAVKCYTEYHLGLFTRTAPTPSPMYRRTIQGSKEFMCRTAQFTPAGQFICRTAQFTPASNSCAERHNSRQQPIHMSNGAIHSRIQFMCRTPQFTPAANSYVEQRNSRHRQASIHPPRAAAHFTPAKRAFHSFTSFLVSKSRYSPARKQRRKSWMSSRGRSVSMPQRRVCLAAVWLSPPAKTGRP